MVTVRVAQPQDAPPLARMLDAFNSEYEDFTPGPEFLEKRLTKLLEDQAVTAFVAGDEAADGFVLFRLRPSLWSDSLDAYIEELYVVPELRGKGIGLALMEAALDAAREAGARYVDLGTSEDDVAARGLYEKLGFDCHEGKGSGSLALFYEREL